MTAVAGATTASPHEVARLRLVTQRLVGPPEATAADAVRWMLAVQAQDLPGALTSVALRSSGRARAEVIAALDAGEIVRSWPMRGTLHLVAAEDLPWMVDLLAPRVLAASVARRAGLGVAEADVERAGELAGAALAGGRRLARAELFAAWDDAGLSTAGQRGVHLLRVLAMTGALVYGPTRGGEPLLVRADEWIPHPRRPGREEATAELALRYFRSHGPATLADLVRWTGLRVGDARAGLADVRPQLAALDVDGVEHLLDPEVPQRLAAARAAAGGVLLLPGFDELLLGYADRSVALDPEFADRIVPGGNGVFRPTVVSDGRVVGTWATTGRGARARLTATPFTAFAPEVEAAIPVLHAALP